MLQLRQTIPSDLPAFFEHQRDPAAVRMAAFTAKDPDDRAAFDAHWARILADRDIIMRTIVIDGQVAGSISSYLHEGNPEVTYWIGREFWGRGIATAALAEFLKLQTGRPIFARAAKDNIGSLRVLEKCGFEIIGEDRGYANGRGEEIEEYVLARFKDHMSKSNEADNIAQWLPAGVDLHGEYRGLGVSHIDFKLAPPGNESIFIIENIFHARGGPARHLHHEQDEWFMVLEGEFLMEVGGDSKRLGPGDSLFAPRRIPHVWAFVGDGRGRVLIAFTPAGRMEAFFGIVTGANAMPPQDPTLWADHGMQLLGPPLPVE